MMDFFGFDWISDPSIWLSLVTLAGLEIILGIDNLVFIAILTNRLPEERRAAARKVGMAMALGTRLMLLAAIAWIVTLTRPIVTVAGFALSWRDIILLAGGVFLLVKATHEMHNEVEGDESGEPRLAAKSPTFGATVVQIAVIDIIFSIDSVITAVGMADQLWVMVLAVMIAMGIMLAASTPLANFVSSHPTVKMLALSFLLMIGVVLVADGLHFHIPKGYIYFSLFFSISVETLNHVVRRRRSRRKGA
jgi:predicted tellurium resistance membrane protein TerC